MAPQINEIKELQYTIKNRDVRLRYQQFKPKSNADFISTQGTGKRDISFFASGTGGGIAINPFYVGASRVKDFDLGNSLHVLNSKDQTVTIVHIT